MRIIELCDLALLYSNSRVQQLAWGFKERQKDLKDFILQRGGTCCTLLDGLYSLGIFGNFYDLELNKHCDSTQTNENSQERNPDRVPPGLCSG